MRVPLFIGLFLLVFPGLTAWSFEFGPCVARRAEAAVILSNLRTTQAPREAEAITTLRHLLETHPQGPELTAEVREANFKFQHETAEAVAALSDRDLYLAMDEWITRTNQERPYLNGLRPEHPVKDVETFLRDLLAEDDGHYLFRQFWGNLTGGPSGAFANANYKAVPRMVEPVILRAIPATLDVAIFEEFRRRLLAGTWSYGDDPQLIQAFRADRRASEPAVQRVLNPVHWNIGAGLAGLH